MTFDQTNWVWMNGDIVNWSDATVHVSAHALHYGSGVFEGMRCYETEGGPAVFRMDAHLDRLFSSADAYGIRIPYSKPELYEAVCETIRVNEFTSCYALLLDESGNIAEGSGENRFWFAKAVC